MTAYDPKDIERMYVNKLNMQPTPRKGDPHGWFELQIQGHSTIATKLATNHKQEIRDELISKMSRQLRITPKIFRGLMDCHVQKDEYITIVQSNNN
jgi:hypothetical protein